MKKIVSLLFLAALTLGAWAQQDSIKEPANRFSIDVQVRTRAEYNGGAQVPLADGQRRAFFINNRARIGLGYQWKWIELKLGVQHTGVWGQDDIKDKLGRVAMNEAWVKLNWYHDLFFAQIGRQQLSYDDERILGGLDWNVAGNWHDAIRIGFDNGTHKVHLLGAYNQQGENIRGGFLDPSIKSMPYKMMIGAWYHFQAQNAPLGLSVLFLENGFENGTAGNGSMRHMQTLGAHLTSNPANCNLAASFYYQHNEIGIQNSYLASVRGGYNFDVEKAPISLTLGYDFLSQGFNPLYGTHHKFYGSMDYFYASAWAKGLQPGLHDAMATFGIKPHKKVNMTLTYHYFATVEDYTNINPDFKHTLGHELDFQLNAKLHDFVLLQAGYSFMVGTPTMDYVKGGSHNMWNDWAFISLNVNPRVFNKKW